MGGDMIIVYIAYDPTFKKISLVRGSRGYSRWAAFVTLDGTSPNYVESPTVAPLWRCIGWRMIAPPISAPNC